MSIKHPILSQFIYTWTENLKKKKKGNLGLVHKQIKRQKSMNQKPKRKSQINNITYQPELVVSSDETEAPPPSILLFLSSSYSGSSVGNSNLQTGHEFLEPNQGKIQLP